MSTSYYQKKTIEALALIQSVKCRPVRKPYKKLETSLKKIMQPFSRKYGVTIKDLLPFWHEIIGEELAEHTKPVRFETVNKQKRLVIKTSSSFAFLIQMKTPEILERLNRMVGTRNVKRLRLVQSDSYLYQRNRAAKSEKGHFESSAPPLSLNNQEVMCLNKKLRIITNEDLRKSLENLGRNMLLNEKKASDK